MTLDIKTLKITCVNSALFGALLAIPALIPNIMPYISLFLLPFLSAVILLIFMEIRFPGTQKEIRDYALLGAVIGAVSCFSFLIIFSPLTLLLHFFIKTYYTYGLNFLNFFLAIILLISIMLIFASTNAAGGLLVGFLIKQFRKN